MKRKKNRRNIPSTTTEDGDIADVRGISYSYSLLWRFGMITVPEEVEKKLRGQ